MKYVIIGGNTGGAGAAARLRRLDEQARIVMLEKGGHVSYSNCSLPYRLSGTVDQTEKLVLNTPEALRDSYNIETRTASEAVAIDRQAKQVQVKDLATARCTPKATISWCWPRGPTRWCPASPASREASLFTVKTVDDVARLHSFLQQQRRPAGVGDRRRLHRHRGSGQPAGSRL